MKKHSCRTYFHIAGSFNTQEVLDRLGVSPSKVVNKGDTLSKAGRIADCDRIDIGFNDSYNVDINEMIRVTIKDLRSKIDVLAELRETYKLEYYLVVVPEIESESEDPSPILSLDDDIIEFLYLTKAKHDLDYYVY